jgi:hypothetical protein
MTSSIAERRRIRLVGLVLGGIAGVDYGQS